MSMEFELKLEAIESKREYKKPRRLFAVAGSNKRISEIIDEQKISLIRNFSVPNTKEDILEFMILATSNIDVSSYGSLDEPADRVKAMTEAWNAKIKQVYAKAKTTYKSDPDFSKIQELYDSCYAEVRKQKKKKIWYLSYGDHTLKRKERLSTATSIWYSPLPTPLLFQLTTASSETNISAVQTIT